MKKIIAILVCLILSAVIVFLMPNLTSITSAIDIEHTNEKSLVKQNVIDYNEQKNTYYKLYYNGSLVGVINSMDRFNELINEEYYKFEQDYPDASLGLINDCYIVDETSNIVFENKDDEIARYAIDNKFLGVRTTSVELSNKDGVFDIIYILNKDDFIEARDNFLKNFISEDSLNKITNKEEIASPSDFGSIDTGLSIDETITFSESIVAPENILSSPKEIYEYLCYGRSEERQYYETQIGDTVQAVGYHFGDMTARQIMMLNPDVIFDEDQILAPGTSLNVTYYNPPLTVRVTKQRLAQEPILPESPIYVEDNTIEKGTRRIDIEEENGLENVLYEEIWINGVVQEGQKISSNVIKDPVQGVIAIGTYTPRDVGTGNWGFPVDNPIITCNYVCYSGHGGVDFQNRYARWDYVKAADSGVVVAVGWTDIGGYFVRIDHNNGYVTYYGHMRTYPYVAVGQAVNRGDILGPIGMTGVATGPHVHFAMYYNDHLIDPCSVVACSLVSWG